MCPNLIGSSFGHEHSSPPIGFAIEPVSRTHTHKFNIKIRVTKTHTHRWNRYIIIINSPKTKIHKYNVSGKVGPVVKTHRWNAGGKVVPSRRRTHKYNIKGKITKTKTHKFTIRILVTALPRTHKFNIIGKIVSTYIHKWNAGGLVKPPKYQLHKYDIIERINPSKTHGWNILTPKILTTDLGFYKSSNTADSLGGAIDTNSPITDNELYNLFDVITATESTTGETEFRCLYVRNNETRSRLDSAKVWLHITSPNTSSITISIGLGTSEINGTEQTIATEETVPADVTFTTLTGLNNALAIGGNLTAGQHKAIWLKREVAAQSQAYDNDNFTIGMAGDTYASN